MENQDEIIVQSEAKVQEEYGIKKGDKFTESVAYEVARKINESKKGKAIVEKGQLKVKDLIVG